MLRIDTPFRDGAHARHDAKHLNLPLFVTTEDDDVASIDVFTEERGQTQHLIRRGGKDTKATP